MLEITIPRAEFYDEKKEMFVVHEEETLQLEHSLYSVSKWESKWKKPFLDNKTNKTQEEVLDYIKCMSLNTISSIGYLCLTRRNVEEINNYMQDSMTATTITNHKPTKHNREVLTAELIYYYMTALNIPFECDRWHLNKLMMLIEVCSIKNQPPKKMGKKATMKSNAAINAQRRKALHSNG